MPRENIEPQRISHATQALENLGFEPQQIGIELRFLFKGHIVYFFPYSGWFQGKSVKKGRGLRNLLTQLKEGKQS